MTKKSNIKIIGHAIFKNFEEFGKWYVDEGVKWGNDHWSSLLYEEQTVVGGGVISDIYQHMYNISCPFYREKEALREYEIEQAKRFLDDLAKVQNYIESYHFKYDLLYRHDVYCIIGFGSEENKYIIPTEFLEIELLKNYDNLPVSELKTLTGDNENHVVQDNALSNCSVSSVKTELSDKTKKLKDMEQQAEDIKNAKMGKLAEMQAEIDRKKALLQEEKQKMMDVLNAKKEEMQKQVDKMNNQIFVLDTEIYGIRCFLGEVIKFAQLRKGKNADIKTPAVLYQKIRFLDEEMGKMCSIYDIDWGEHELFEEFITAREDVFEMFCPTQKCVTLVRISDILPG